MRNDWCDESRCRLTHDLDLFEKTYSHLFVFLPFAKQTHVLLGTQLDLFSVRTPGGGSVLIQWTASLYSTYDLLVIWLDSDNNFEVYLGLSEQPWVRVD